MSPPAKHNPPDDGPGRDQIEAGPPRHSDDPFATMAAELCKEWFAPPHLLISFTAAALRSVDRAAREDCAAKWRPIETAPENLRVIVQVSDSPLNDEIAMAWKDQMDGLWYYAPQGGLLEWTPTDWTPIPEAPIKD